ASASTRAGSQSHRFRDKMATQWSPRWGTTHHSRPPSTMHCRECDYALWNLTEARCPECGSPFDVGDYVFERGTVAFACPLCGHEHDGMGPLYQPWLGRDSTCRGCG